MQKAMSGGVRGVGGKAGELIEMSGGQVNIPLKDGKSVSIPVDKITYEPGSRQINISEEMGKTAIWKQLVANESNPNFQAGSGLRSRCVSAAAAAAGGAVGRRVGGDDGGGGDAV